MGVSVVLLTLDSARHLRACLDGLRWADEVIALDGGSRDATRSILASYGCRIHPQPADLIERHRGNFDVARNVGFALARENWTLVVDSDEVVSPALRDAILAAVRRDLPVAYAIPRTNLFWGRPTRLLGQDLQLRLFPRGSARYEGCRLDARPSVSCPVEELAEPLLHRQADSPRELLVKLHRRTSQGARARLGEPAVEREAPWPLLYHTFRYYYRQQGAAAEGLRGLVLSLLYAAQPALTQLKLRRLERRGAPRPLEGA